jgi:hypothetical protein
MFTSAHDESVAAQQAGASDRISTAPLLPRFPAAMEQAASAPVISAAILTEPRPARACGIAFAMARVTYESLAPDLCRFIAEPQSTLGTAKFRRPPENERNRPKQEQRKNKVSHFSAAQWHSIGQILPLCPRALRASTQPRKTLPPDPGNRARVISDPMPVLNQNQFVIR